MKEPAKPAVAGTTADMKETKQPEETSRKNWSPTQNHIDQVQARNSANQIIELLKNQKINVRQAKLALIYVREDLENVQIT